MFSIFSYIMSRVTHSEPGLPMIYCSLQIKVTLRCVSANQSKISVDRRLHSQLQDSEGQHRGKTTGFQEQLTAKQATDRSWNHYSRLNSRKKRIIFQNNRLP